MTASVDVTGAKRLAENGVVGFLGIQGIQKGGPFDVVGSGTQKWLALPLNPNGRPNSDVVKPRWNGYDIMRRSQGNWIVDFGPNIPESEAALYEAPFEHVQTHVMALRAVNPRKT